MLKLRQTFNQFLCLVIDWSSDQCWTLDPGGDIVYAAQSTAVIQYLDSGCRLIDYIKLIISVLQLSVATHSDTLNTFRFFYCCTEFSNIQKCNFFSKPKTIFAHFIQPNVWMHNSLFNNNDSTKLINHQNYCFTI